MTRERNDTSSPGGELRQRPALYLVRPDTLPPGAAPAQRMVASGPSALNDSELLLTLLEGPNAHLTAQDLHDAEASLRRLGGLYGLFRADLDTLTAELGPVRAIQLKAAQELAVRFTRSALEPRELLDQPALVADYVTLRHLNSDQEVMGALYLDVRSRFIDERELFRGTLDRVAVDPRTILKHGLLLDAASAILFHTHPTGDPSPSLEDLAFTRRLAQAGEAVGIRLVDHIIVGAEGRWVSLKRRGGW